MRYWNPIYKKELKQMARTKKMLLLLCIYNLLLAGLGLFMLYFSFDGGAGFSKNADYSGILILYAVMGGLEFVMVLLIIPAVTAGTIAGEREKQTLDLLLSSGISTFKIISGKLAASVSMVLLLAVSSLPVLSIVFSIGGIALKDIVELFVLLTVTAVYLGSVGMFFSVCCKKTTMATVNAYLAMFFLVFLFPMAFSFSEFFLFFDGFFFSMSRFGMYFSGKKSIFLLPDPLISYISLLRKQTGRGITFMNAIGNEGGIMYFLSKNWFSISMTIQILISVAVMAFSAHLLTPSRKGGH